MNRNRVIVKFWVKYFSFLYFSTFHFAKWSANAQWDGGATKGLCWENVSRNPQRRLSRLSPSNMLEEKCENPIGRNGSGGLWKIKKCVNIDRCWDFVFGKNELFVKKKIEKAKLWLNNLFSIWQGFNVSSQPWTYLILAKLNNLWHYRICWMR